MTRTQFARAIAKERAAQGLTRGQLAEQIGRKEDAIRSVENGCMPSILKADEILKALGVKMVLGSKRSRKSLNL